METVDKNEKKIHLRKAILQDKTDDIPITIFGNLGNQINNEDVFHNDVHRKELASK